ncbi:MAG: Trk system potassium transporter TrkA [Bacteroidales bacterium]
MKIVLAGAGEVGSHLAKMLSHESHDITVIDNDETRLENLSAYADVIPILGQPTSIETLKSAGVSACDLFIAVSPAKEQDVNLVSALLAKSLGAKKVTARINNEEYQKNENKLLFTELGIDSLFYPERIAASEIINLLKETATSEFMDYAHGKLQLVVFRLEEGAPLIDKTLKEYLGSTGDKLKFRAVAISRDGNTIIPHSRNKFKAKDLVFIISMREGVDEALAVSGKERLSVKDIMILGGGRIGEMVARKLEKSVDNIKLIEKKSDRCEFLSQNLNKTLVINGDGRNSDLMFDEDIKDYDAFVAVTSSSETNILSCVVAKRAGVPKVIAEVENFEYIKLAEEMGVDTVINKKYITAGKIFRLTLSNKIRSIKILNGTDAQILEFIVNHDSKITTSKLSELNFPAKAIIGGVIRGTESFIADKDSVIKAYDQVVVFADPSVVSEVDKFFL